MWRDSSRRRNSTGIGTGRWNQASWNACRVRWCDRAIGPSKRWRATMRDWITRSSPPKRSEAKILMSTAPGREPLIRYLGSAPYEPTWRAMQKFTDQRQDETADEIWFVEHPPVFTLGLNASREHLLTPRHSRGAN